LAVTQAARAATAMGAELFFSWQLQPAEVGRGRKRFSTVLRVVLTASGQEALPSVGVDSSMGRLQVVCIMKA